MLLPHDPTPQTCRQWLIMVKNFGSQCNSTLSSSRADTASLAEPVHEPQSITGKGRNDLTGATRLSKCFLRKAASSMAENVPILRSIGPGGVDPRTPGGGEWDLTPTAASVQLPLHHTQPTPDRTCLTSRRPERRIRASLA
jgi:hypothetical protein